MPVVPAPTPKGLGCVRKWPAHRICVQHSCAARADNCEIARLCQTQADPIAFSSGTIATTLALIVNRTCETECCTRMEKISVKTKFASRRRCRTAAIPFSTGSHCGRPRTLAALGLLRAWKTEAIASSWGSVRWIRSGQESPGTQAGRNFAGYRSSKPERTPSCTSDSTEYARFKNSFLDCANGFGSREGSVSQQSRWIRFQNGCKSRAFGRDRSCDSGSYLCQHDCMVGETSSFHQQPGS